MSPPWMHTLALFVGSLAAAVALLALWLASTGRSGAAIGLILVVLVLASQAWRIKGWARRMDAGDVD